MEAAKVEPKRTLGCHIIELNDALNLNIGSGQDQMTQENQDKLEIKRTVLDYV